MVKTIDKNGNEVPMDLEDESDGTRRLIEYMPLIYTILKGDAVYIVDEIERSIHPILIKSIISKISDSHEAKGQLIFTSHNLRPLETIDKGFIAFTTTNPKMRYIRLTNVKGTNNLRDFYYRDIVLGEQSEQVYNPTNNFEIALAFREAGEAFGS